MASYDAERRPIGTRNTLEAADNYARSGDIFSAVHDIEDEGPQGESKRAAIAATLPPKIKHFAPIGVHLGYYYEHSPIITSDGTAPPPYEAANYRPTARPGHRAPHVWLGDGRSMLDLFGRGFTLLNFGCNEEECAGMINAAAACGMPLAINRIDDAVVASAYGARLCLVRPDGHVAWRGDHRPDDPQRIIDVARGAG
jgi:hypothetical protein